MLDPTNKLQRAVAYLLGVSLFVAACAAPQTATDDQDLTESADEDEKPASKKTTSTKAPKKDASAPVEEEEEEQEEQKTPAKPTCAAGKADCNGVASDGCEVVTSTDPKHCGGCGQACDADQECKAGTCVAPPRGTATCESDCTKDQDCVAPLVCHKFPNGTAVCSPPSCETCYAQKRGCSYNFQTCQTASCAD